VRLFFDVPTSCDTGDTIGTQAQVTVDAPDF
jgi:hypothetical protein